MAPVALTLYSTSWAPSAPLYHDLQIRQATTSRPTTGDWRKGATTEEFILESWSQGVVVGALMIMGCITAANMRRGVLLHKLILAELLLAMSHGTFCFMSFHGYGWYLSSTAMLLYFSWIMHNIVAWLKVRPFFSQPGGFFKPTLGTWTTRIYLGTLALTVPAIVFQISNNFRFFNDRGGWYKSTRPYEPLMRDPWWIFTCIALFHVIQKCYGTGAVELLRRSPRFGILLAAIFLSIVFTVLDIAASISSTAIIGQTEGINPWWKLSLVFKCLTDTIMLDDFKTELKRLGIKRIAKEDKRRNTISLVDDNDHPLPGEEYESKSGSSDRKLSRWFRNNSLAQTSTARDISPTTSTQKTNGIPNGHVNNHGIKALNDPNADIDNLDFTTALYLDTSHVSGAESTKTDIHNGHEPTRQPRQRDSITNHTKHLSNLPSLTQWTFQPSKTNSGPNAQDKSESHRKPQQASDATSTTHPTATDTIEPVKSSITIEEPELPRRDNSNNNNHNTPKPKRNTHEHDEHEHEHEDGNASPIPKTKSSNDNERVQRFKYSIGA